VRERGQKLQLKKWYQILKRHCSWIFKFMFILWYPAGTNSLKMKSSYVGGQTIMVCNVPCRNTRKTTLLPYIQYIYIMNCWIKWMDKKAFKYLKFSTLLQNEIWIVYCIFIFHYYYYSSIILFQNIDQSHFFERALEQE